MSFWELSTGKPASGSAEAAHAPNYAIIPDGTLAFAMIKEVKLNEGYEGAPDFYNITWQITSEDFKNRLVFQKLHCFDSKPSKKDRAIEMLMRLFKLCEYRPSHSGVPTETDFLPIKGKILGIKIQEWQVNGKEGNYVSELHEAKDFVPEAGEKMAPAPTYSGIESAFSRNPRVDTSDLNDDIPF